MTLRKKALIVISSADKLKLKEPEMDISIGFFIVEMGKVLEIFKDKYEFIFATPDGKTPTIDLNGESLVMQTASKFFTESTIVTTELKLSPTLESFREKNEEYVNRRYRELKLTGELLGKLKVSEALPKSNKEAIDFRREIVEYMDSLKEKKIYSIKEILNSYNISDFSFVHMPGGHAPMMDFIDNYYLGELLNRIYENKVPLSLICHAPIALSSAKYRVDEEENIKIIDNYGYKGAKITVFGKVEELEVSIGGFYHVPGKKTRLEYYASDKLIDDGYNVDTTKMFLPKVIYDEDKLLLTGNGPQAIDILTEKLKEIIWLILNSLNTVLFKGIYGVF